jgi:hypothetical protein
MNHKLGVSQWDEFTGQELGVAVRNEAKLFECSPSWRRPASFPALIGAFYGERS